MIFDFIKKIISKIFGFEKKEKEYKQKIKELEEKVKKLEEGYKKLLKKYKKLKTKLRKEKKKIKPKKIYINIVEIETVEAYDGTELWVQYYLDAKPQEKHYIETYSSDSFSHWKLIRQYLKEIGYDPDKYVGVRIKYIGDVSKLKSLTEYFEEEEENE